MRHSFAAIPVAFVAFSMACGSSPSTTSGVSNLTQTSYAQVLASLSFLNTASTVAVVDPGSSDGTQDMGLLNAAIAADPDTSTWMANAGTEASPHILSVGFSDGTSAIVATREWVTGDASSPSSRSSIAYISPPSGTPFGYAEKHVYQAGNVDVASFWTLDSPGAKGFQAAGGYTFNPATAEQQNVDSNAGNVPITPYDGGADGSAAPPSADGASPEAASGTEDAATEDAVAEGGAADGGAADGESESDGGAMGQAVQGNLSGSLRTQGLLSNGTTDSCALCADGLLAAKLLGVAAAYATGTGAATAVCALVGIPTAEVGGVACHIVVVAVSTAALLPWNFDARAGDCNYVSHTVLGMNPICANVASPTTPPTGSNAGM